jgi:transcriptional regulator with XRE-family HTH domain
MLSKRILQYRARHNLSQRQMGELMRMSATQICRIEKGGNHWHFKELQWKEKLEELEEKEEKENVQM